MHPHAKINTKVNYTIFFLKNKEVFKKLRGYLEDSPFELFPSVKFGIVGVKILRIKIVLCYAHSVAEALVMYYLSFTQKLDRIAHVGVINKS